jgi:hypothetical protein
MAASAASQIWRKKKTTLVPSVKMKGESIIFYRVRRVQIMGHSEPTRTSAPSTGLALNNLSQVMIMAFTEVINNNNNASNGAMEFRIVSNETIENHDQ